MVFTAFHPSQRPKTLRTCLEVMVVEMLERLRLRSVNQDKLSERKAKLYEMLEHARSALRYARREGAGLRQFYEQIFAVERGSRQQEAECWRDIVMVTHALLPVWQAHEQAHQRARMLGGL